MAKNKIILYILFLCFCIGVIGCSTTGPYKEFSGIVSQLRKGMTQDEVKAIAGEPTFEGKGMNWRTNELLWTYTYRETGSFWREVFLDIFFKDDKVVDWQEKFGLLTP